MTTRTAPRNSLLDGQATAFVSLAGIGVAIGLMHLPLSLELGVTLAHQNGKVRTLGMLLYPVAMALTGLGAVLAMWRPRWVGTGVLRLAALSLLGVLVAALKINFLSDFPPRLFAAWGAHLLTIGAWYLALGAGQTVLLAQVRRDAPKRVAAAWAVHLVGLLVGYAVSEGAVVFAGANAVLLVLALSLLVSPRLAVLLVVPGLLLAQKMDLDGHLESWRDLGAGLETDAPNGSWKDKRYWQVHSVEAERVYLGWSRLGQVQVFDTANDVVAFYNLRHMFEHPREVGETDASGVRFDSGETGDLVREVIYESFSSNSRVLIVGVGAGRSLHYLTRGPVTEAVERDPAAARFFSELRPDLNQHAFADRTLTVADGRFVLDRSSDTYDAIVLESSRYGPMHPRLPLVASTLLYTREALTSAFRRLSDRGVLVVEVKRAGEAESHLRFTTHLYNTLVALSDEVGVVQTGKRDTTLLIACATPGCYPPLQRALQNASAEQLRFGWPHDWGRDVPVLTDDQPFSAFVFGSSRQKGRLFLVGVVLTLLASLPVVVLHQRDQSSAWRAAPWFFALGVGHTGLQLHAFHTWRTYFGDELRTVMVLIVGWLAFGALGSALAPRMKVTDRKRALAWTVGLVGAHLLLQANLPFHADASVRWPFAVLAAAPGGVLLGMWMPLGLSRAAHRGLGTWLAADALGTLAATSCLYCLLVPLGATAYLMPFLLAYGWVAWRWPTDEPAHAAGRVPDSL